MGSYVNKNAAANRRLAQWRVTWLIKLSTSHQLLWCFDSFVLRIENQLNPPEYKARNRIIVFQQYKMRNAHFVLNEQSSESLKHSSHYGIEKFPLLIFGWISKVL